MSVGDRNMFPRPGPEQIRNRQFVWVRKGYDPEQVKDFLAQIADHIESLEAELRTAREEAERSSERQTSARDEAYEVAKRMADMLEVADQHSDANDAVDEVKPRAAGVHRRAGARATGAPRAQLKTASSDAASEKDRHNSG